MFDKHATFIGANEVSDTMSMQIKINAIFVNRLLVS